MGISIIPTRANGNTIDETWYNVLKDALTVALVPRNASGVPTDQGGTLGDSLRAWAKVYFGASASAFTLEDDGAGNIVFKIAGSIVAKFSTAGLSRSSIEPTDDTDFGLSPNSGSITSTSYVDVAGATCTVTTRGRPVLLVFAPGQRPHNHHLFDLSGGPNAEASIAIQNVTGGVTLLDHPITLNTVAAITAQGMDAVNSNALTGITAAITSSQLQAPFSCVVVDSIVAGTYTYKVQAKVVSGSTLTLKNWALTAIPL